MKLYHYTSIDSFIKIWDCECLKFSVGKTTNDSFEHNKNLMLTQCSFPSAKNNGLIDMC